MKGVLQRAWKRHRALLALLLASVFFRAPLLINANALNSDAAIVALQARHILEGEWSWFLWGVGYLSAVDPLMLAIGFFFFGDSSFTVRLVPLIGHLLVVAMAFAMARRWLGPWLAAVALIPLTFVMPAVNQPIEYAARQYCIVLVFLAWWLADGASERRRPVIAFFASGVFAALALYVDLFGLQFMPAAVVLALLAALDRGERPGEEARRRLAAEAAPLTLSEARHQSASAGVAREGGSERPGRLPTFAVRFGGWIVGAAVGLIPVLIVRSVSKASGAPASVVFDRVASNATLLWETCLPFLLGYKVWRPGHSLYPDLWDPPALFVALQWLGAAVLLLGIASGALLFFKRTLPWQLRRLGLVGAGTAATALCAFLVSTMPTDMWSARYLAPLVWASPLAIAPAVFSLRNRSWIPLAPYALSVGIGGWLAYGLMVSGPLPALEPRADLAGERQVQALLRSKDVHHGAAQYWLAYRMTFLLREDPVIVPLSPGEDRYPPMRAAFNRAPRVAYVFHPSEPRAQPGPVEAYLRRGGARYERHEVGGFTVLIHHKW